MRIVKFFMTFILVKKPNVVLQFFFQLSAQLSDMIGVTNPTQDGFSWSLLKIQKDEPDGSRDMPLVLEGNLKLAVALGVLNECFNPVKDRRTKIDMLHQAVYSLG